jgi:hypothetical protein
MTSRLCPARQKREFWSPIFINRRSRLLVLRRRDFLTGNDFIGLLHRCGVRESFFLYSITRESQQRQPTLRLWTARELDRFYPALSFLDVSRGNTGDCWRIEACRWYSQVSGRARLHADPCTRLATTALRRDALSSFVNSLTYWEHHAKNAA